MPASTFASFVEPSRVWSRSEVLGPPSPVPKASGIYAWYFREIPGCLPTDGCVGVNGHTLRASRRVGVAFGSESATTCAAMRKAPRCGRSGVAGAYVQTLANV